MISFGYKTKNNYIRVSKGALIIIKRRTNTSSMYKLIRKAVIGGVADAKSDHDSIVLWYMRLGHLGENGMATFHKNVY